MAKRTFANRVYDVSGGGENAPWIKNKRRYGQPGASAFVNSAESAAADEKIKELRYEYGSILAQFILGDMSTQELVEE